MEALIIAAGKGSRLNHYFSPKPLITVSRYSLIEHIIHRVKNAKITQFKIVIGYKADQIKKNIGNGEKLGVSIEYIHNPKWTKGNGLSVYRARDCLEDNFILLMGDHLFDGSILNQLLMVKIEKDGCVLCVDHKIESSHIDVNEATRVWEKNGKVKKIGKEIHPFNCIDTGIFLYSSIIFDALEENISRGKDLLTDANQTLSDWGKLECLDIGSRYWIDVDDKETLKMAEEKLRQKKL